MEKGQGKPRVRVRIRVRVRVRVRVLDLTDLVQDADYIDRNDDQNERLTIIGSRLGLGIG